MNLVYKVCT